MITVLFNKYWNGSIKNGKSFLSENLDVRFRKAETCIHFFYFLVFFLSIKAFSPYGQFPFWKEIVASKPMFSPEWSLFWINQLNWEIAVKLILIAYFLCSFATLIFWKKSRIIRALLFLSMFTYLSLIFSFKNRESWMYLMNMAAFILIFIPNSSDSNSAQKKGLLSIVFGIQTLLLMSYFSSGFFKILGFVRQEWSGAISALDKLGFPEFSAMNAYHHQKEYFFTHFVLDNPSKLFTIFLLMGICVEFFSIHIIFRPKLHRLWSLLILLMHGLILMLIGPDFSIQVLMVGVFLFFSPFHDSFDIKYNLKTILGELKENFLYPGQDKIYVHYKTTYKALNHVLVDFAKEKGSFDLTLYPKKNASFTNMLSEKYPDVPEEESLLVEIASREAVGSKKVLLNANAFTYLWSSNGFKYKIIRALYLVAPIIGEVLFEISIRSLQWLKSIRKID